MVRIIFLAIAVLLIFLNLRRINRKVLTAKAFIFLAEIKKKKSIEEANYNANLFDFFKKPEAKSVFQDVKKVLEDEYDNKRGSLIYRAETLGFYDTHSRAMFAKKKRVKKLIAGALLTLPPEDFSENAARKSRQMAAKYWDINALLMSYLDDRVAAMKLLLEEYKDTKEAYLKVIATKFAGTLTGDIQYLDKEDIDVINEWKNICEKTEKKTKKK